MTDLSTTLHEANIKSVMFIDDAYDSAPTPGDLVIDDDEWSTFFDDITQDDEAIIQSFYPLYEQFEADDLVANADFVKQLWINKSDLRSDLIDPLFERYEYDTNEDIEYLTPVITQLEGMGLECSTSGRVLENEEVKADLIIIDLFLSSAQKPVDMELSISILKNIVESRPTNPPLIILTSRNPSLEKESSYFRDKAGLFESGFRFIPKKELTEAKFSRLLSRLARHHEDTLKLANFVFSWENGLISASKRTASQLRRLNISDFAQIDQLLLRGEGDEIGTYLVDIFDNVLKHEVEKETSIIETALELNKLDLDNYPPPYVTGSSNLQEIVGKLLYTSTQRLKLKSESSGLLSFGDMLTYTLKEDLQAPFSDRVVPEEHVLLVVTPACDLQRAGAKNVTLLIGSLIELTADNWDHDQIKTRTPVFFFNDSPEKKYLIKWDLKHIETISQEEFKPLLEHGVLKVSARMRESYALELQQKLLSDIGRIGQVATMPGTFNVDVNIYLISSADQRPFKVIGLQGSCYVNREKVKKLVISESLCEKICSELSAIDADRVWEHSHQKLKTVAGTDELLKILESGLTIPTSSGLKQVKSSTIEEGKNPEVLGFITKELSLTNQIARNQAVNAGVIIEITN